MFTGTNSSRQFGGPPKHLPLWGGALGRSESDVVNSSNKVENQLLKFLPPHLDFVREIVRSQSALDSEALFRIFCDLNHAKYALRPQHSTSALVVASPGPLQHLRTHHSASAHQGVGFPPERTATRRSTSALTTAPPRPP
jgi:hypothetical protein